MDHPFLFVSYVRADSDRVRPVVDAIRRELERRVVPVELWMDLFNLQPGQAWAQAIAEALNSAVGLLLFVSSSSLSSEFIREELRTVTKGRDRLVIPILLEQFPALMPPELRELNALDLSGHPTKKQISAAASNVVDAVEKFLGTTRAPRPAVAKAEAPAIAANLAQELRAPETQKDKGAPPASVFVVHGHSDKALAELEAFLTSIAVEPIVLSRQGEPAQSLFQKFMAVAAKAKFAVVVMSSDDYGASRRQYDAAGVGERAMQFRARQNVVLELGFFYGRLGWENVFVVYENPDREFPNFERPSDLDGVVFDSMSDAAWQRNLRAKLEAAGFVIRAI